MLQQFFSVRVNFAILSLGAIAVLAMVKLTALLPTQYYFTFSRFIVGTKGPFLVDPPSVSGRKLCDLLAKHRLLDRRVGSHEVDCTQSIESKSVPAPRLLNETKDRIYAVALTSDREIRKLLEQSISQVRLAPLEPGRFDRALEDGQTIDGVRDEIARAYEESLLDPLRAKLGEAFQKAIQAPPGAPTEQQRERPSIEPLSAEEQRSISQAMASFVERLKPRMAQVQLKPIQKSHVDEFVSLPDAEYAAAEHLTEYYLGQVRNEIGEQLRQSFEEAGLKTMTSTEAKQLVFREVTAAGIRDYVVAALLRLAPVILFGFVLGLFATRDDVLSIGLAAGLAALLLCWPLILSWEQLVLDRWQSQRPMFTAFYAVYVLSFYVTARMSALIAMAIRQGFGRSVNVRDVAVSVLAGIAINLAVFSWNVTIPLLVKL
jgi:hypothetical protein